MAIEKELEAWPEKKLYVEGVFKIRIKVLMSSVLFGRNLAIACLVRSVRVVTNQTIISNVTITNTASRFGYFQKIRAIKKIKSGVQFLKSVTVIQK